MSDTTGPRYKVHWQAKGYTSPDANNPKGIKVSAEGYVLVDGVRPDSNFKIPMEAAVRAKKIFMEECFIERFDGDKPGEERFPTVWLGEQL